jgi:hypothetical protein
VRPSFWASASIFVASRAIALVTVPQGPAKTVSRYSRHFRVRSDSLTRCRYVLGKKEYPKLFAADGLAWELRTIISLCRLRYKQKQVAQGGELPASIYARSINSEQSNNGVYLD